MDPGTGLTILGSAIGGAKLIEKLLGPTAAYLGDLGRDWTRHRIENVSRIFKNATNRLGDTIEQPGRVPPRLLKEILDEGSVCEDELTAEYYGGILASGRTELGRDDRAVTYVKLISHLSTYQIRFHYVFYVLLRRRYLNSDLRPAFGEDLERMFLYLPVSFVAEVMEFVPDEPGGDILHHCVEGLSWQRLIGNYAIGSAVNINDSAKASGLYRWQEVERAGILAMPSSHGIELFLWAMGRRSIDLPKFLDSELQIADVPGIKIPSLASISGGAVS